MGLSKVFTCCTQPPGEKDPDERPPKIRETTAVTNKSTADLPPQIPPISKAPNKPSNDTANDTEYPKNEVATKLETDPDVSISRKVWNRAYKELATDEGTKSLVEDYMMAVQRANNPDENASESELRANAAKMNNEAERENLMKQTLESGRKRIYKSSNITNAVGGASGFVLKFKDVIDLAVGTNPQAALPWAGICIGLQFMLNPSLEAQANASGLGYVISRMEWYCELTEHLLSRTNIVIGEESYEKVLDRLEITVVEMYKTLLLYQMKSACSYYRNQGWTFIRNIISYDDWKAQLDGVKVAEKTVEDDSKRYNKLRAQSQLGDIARNGKGMLEVLTGVQETLQEYIASQSKKALGDDFDKCLEALHVVDPQAQLITLQSKRDTLIPAAFEWILTTSEYRSFTNWSDGSSCQVLWLNGPAGTGKTMLMIGIIMQLYKESKLAPGISYFFCVAEDTNKNSAMDALRSLIWLLLLQQPHLICYLVETHKRSGADMFRGQSAFYWLRDRFKAMLADENLSPVYLAFDALDECGEATKETPNVQGLLSLISDTLSSTGKNSKKIKWLVSSRPEIDVLNKLNCENQDAVIELDVMAHKEPVDAYVAHQLSQLRMQRRYTDDKVRAISAELGRHENITFLWVALVLKDLLTGDVSQRKAVEHVQGTPPELSAIYDRMIEKIEKVKDEEDREFCMNLLAAVCFASRPLSIAEVQVLAGIPSEAADEILQICGSFLTYHDETIHILHNSTRQHLITYFESHHKGGSCHIHESMAKRSITAMSDGLSYNVYGLDAGTEVTDLPTRKDQDPLASLRYSCEFWVDHLCGPDGPSDGQLLDDGEAFQFLGQHFLHWIEALSLIRKSSTSLSSIRKLTKHLKKTYDRSSRASSFLKDAERFVLKNLSVIEKVPLQTYGAALVFSPNQSEMKIRYWDEKSLFIRSIAGLRNSWDPLLQTHSASNDLKGVLFSPNGRFYAAIMQSQRQNCSKKGVVQLWVAKTGFRAWTLTLEDKQANAVAFSPDSKHLASQSGTVIQIWDLSTGVCTQMFDLKLQKAENPHWFIGTAKSIAFSKDGDAIAVSVGDSVEIWDIFTGKCTKTLDGHTENTISVVFSPDGKLIASASEDQTVKLWNYPLGTCLQTLEVGKYPQTVMFSPNGEKLASVNSLESDSDFNDTLTVWDLPSGTYSHTIGPEPQVQAAVFSSDSKAFAIASILSGKIEFLDASTGGHIQNIRGAGVALDVAVSPINGLLVSASLETVHVWDTDWISEEPLDYHDHAISVLKPSPDGEILATGSVDKTVKIWNINDRTCAKTLDDQPERVRRISFSPDSKTIASATSDGSVRIWDIITGHHTQILGPADNFASPAVVFSEDGAALATASCDKNGYIIQLWDASTGTCKKTVEIGRQKPPLINDIALSSDLQTILMATVYDGGYIVDVTNGVRTHVLHNHDTSEIPVCGLPVISPDGRTCALITSNHELEIWDTTAGTLQQAVSIDSFPTELSFSEDGNYLKTKRWSYKLKSGSLNTSPDLESSRSALGLDGEWLVRGEQRLLWIPPDYRSTSAALGRNKIALTSLAGELLFIEVN